MKKTILLIGLFLITLIAGFFYAESNESASVNQLTSKLSPQTNYLIIHVDDLSKPQPRLISIWGAFISFSDLASIYFQPFFPLASGRVNFQTQFSLSADRRLTDAFLKTFETYDLSITGYIILDDASDQFFQNWAFRTNKTTPVSSLASSSVVQEQRASFSRICQDLSRNSLASVPAPDWKRIYPDHLVPSPNIETIMVHFDRLINRSSKPKCVVLEE